MFLVVAQSELLNTYVFWEIISKIRKIRKQIFQFFFVRKFPAASCDVDLPLVIFDKTSYSFVKNLFQVTTNIFLSYFKKERKVILLFCFSLCIITNMQNNL